MMTSGKLPPMAPVGVIGFPFQLACCDTRQGRDRAQLRWLG